MQGVPWFARVHLGIRDVLRLEGQGRSGRKEGLVGCRLVVCTRSISVVGDERIAEDWYRVSAISRRSASQNTGTITNETGLGEEHHIED